MSSAPTATPPHPVELLFTRLESLERYPAGMVQVPDRIPGFSFFPGGVGLRAATVENPLPAFPVGGVMILGHVFYGEEGFNEQLANGLTDESYATGRNLLPLLEEFGIPLDECFFTNFFMGLVEGEENTGPCPGADDPEYVRWCAEFLRYQVALQEPHLMLILGKEVPPHLKHLGGGLERWANCTSWANIDDQGAVVERAEVGGVAFAAVCLTHPSMRRSNLRHRRYLTNRGEDAERAMLRVGLGAADAIRNERYARAASANADTTAGAVQIIGLDWSTDEGKVGAVRATSRPDGLQLMETRLCGATCGPVNLVAEWIRASEAPSILAIDSPLGWPAQLGGALVGHTAGSRLPHDAHVLFRRVTDRFIYERLRLTPLDVGADRIARTAHSALLFLDRLRGLVGPIPLAWERPVSKLSVIEVYPAATLLAHGLPSRGYKKPGDIERRREIGLRLSGKIQGVEAALGDVLEAPDVLDALVCVLAGQDFLAGAAMQPIDLVAAQREGWIWARAATSAGTCPRRGRVRPRHG